MFSFTMKEIVDASAAKLVLGDGASVVTGIAIDSREVKDRVLFVCFPGERVNGNEFAESALESGAAAVVMTEEPRPEVVECAKARGAAIFRAQDDDPVEFMLRLAAAWRSANPQWKV
ncbi:MAG: UDP-N-acetylmuramoyl-tripeptide--D-alanyl-D-alanine ligase, partial [Olsenella sp.]|nr:UDP-N-acetylmuramoyl-tripeptide--D-alanyl-D-alanine ligase [Olsenella sp.]